MIAGLLAGVAAARLRRPIGPPEELVARLAPGRSFVDVGSLWSIHGRIAFLAEEAGASAVTAVDISGETEEFRAEHARRGSRVRFVQADLHEPGAIEPHDVVWCSGVLYHCPHPILTLERLRAITSQTLVLRSATLPEAAGTVFFPGLSPRERRAYDGAYGAVGGAATRVGLTTPFDPAQGYANWWWGLTPSAVERMLTATGFTVRERATNGFDTRLVATAG